MSALDNMRGPRLETPLLFLLLLLSSLTGTAAFEDDDTVSQTSTAIAGTEQQISPTTSLDPPETDKNTSLPTVLDRSAASDFLEKDTSGPGEPDPTGQTAEEESPDLLLIVIPVVLVVILGAIVGVVIIMRRCKDKAENQEPRKEDLDLEGSSTEKVPMPMFEDDVPSVLELEMEELDQLMQKDG